MNLHLFPVVSLLMCQGMVLALPQYAKQIPNGMSVPNPGPQGGTFAGVGHLKAGGGGENNQFGLDFAANGYKWTEILCRLDSDGDGRSNGEELGDPDCLWSEGQEVAGPAVSHPGIVDTPKAAVSSHCESYDPPEDELTMDIGFSTPTQMDERQTHYICEQMLMDVPTEWRKKMHKIKTGVLVDNAEVLHHLFVFICPADMASIDNNKVGQGPYRCGGNESGCRRVGGWAVGPHEKCEPPTVGVELDFTGMTQMVVKVEAHYDNTSGQSQQDQSGMRIHMTPTLRPLTGRGMVLGMAAANKDFVIPARVPEQTLGTICPTAITEHLERPLYVYAFLPHMHLTGKSMVTEHYRCGKKIGEIGRINAFEFDNQQTYTLDPPVKILPGDSFVTSCVFDASQTDSEIRGGPETNDEMCLNFLRLYPSPATESYPNLMAGCFSFEHGMEARNGREINLRFALGGGKGLNFIRDFASDPSENIGSCCAADNCDELYLALEGEACGVSNDCMDDLICEGGMCAVDPVATTETSSVVSGAAEMTSGASRPGWWP